MNLRPITAGVLYPNINVAQREEQITSYRLHRYRIDPGRNRTSPQRPFGGLIYAAVARRGHGGGWHTAALLPMTRFGDYFSFRRIMRKSSRACVCHPLFSCYSSDTPTSSSTIHAPDPAPRRCMYVLPTVRGLFFGYSSRRLLPIFCPVYGFTFVIL